MLACAAFAAWQTPACAEDEIWVWTTADGAIHYTDDLKRVPEAYRESARIAHKEGGGSYQRIPVPAPIGAQPTRPAGVAGSGPDASDAEAAAEATWRERARAIDARLAELAPLVEACANDHVNLSPGDGSRKRREERDEAARCAQARNDLASARAEREALEESARLEGAPPGWVRPEE